MYGYDHVGMGSGWGWGGIWMILVWLIPILLLVLIFDYFKVGHGKRRDRKALAILDERYARGEIDSEQYLKMHQDLSGWTANPVVQPRACGKLKHPCGKRL